MNSIKNKSKKVLHIITSLNQGGAQKNLLNICSSCEIQSYVICLSKESIYSKKLESIGVENISLNMNIKNLFSFLKLIKIFQVINQFKPDILQTWLYHSDFLGSIIKIFFKDLKLIWTIRHTDISLLGNKLSTYFLIRLLIPLSYFAPNKIIYCANASINSHRKIFYCKSKTTLIRNGLEMNMKRYIEPFFNKTNKSSNKFADQTIFFISIARYHPIKNHLLLLRAFKKAVELSKIKLHLIMLGENVNLKNQSLRNFIIENNLLSVISMKGPKKNIYPYLKKSHFLILSSNSEAFPNVLLEASLCCTPSISTDVGDAKKIIGKYGYITPINDEEALTNAILNSSRLNKKKYENLAIKTRERSLKIFSLKSMISNYNNLYRDLIK